MGVIATGRRLLNRRHRLLTSSTRRTIAEAAIVIAAVVVGVVIGASLERTHSNSNASSTQSQTPTPARPATATPNTGIVTRASAQTLSGLSNALGRPVYWTGPRPNFTYELTLAPNAQRIYLRYLPAGVPLGSPRPDYLSIGTYSVRGAAAALRARAAQPGGVSLKLPHGAVGFYSTARPTSVYIAFPGATEQIEVYDPSPAVALRTAESGIVRPVS
ncbi:MAG: hypothetical protein ACXVH1_13310 [Solirubrobacteraceae bacterium]